MWIGIDDTDSPLGGCTTWVLTELVRQARASGLDLLGEPRLVRLNPNIPWKTRGNAALSLHLGHGRGRSRAVGEIDGAPVRTFARGRAPSEREATDFFEAAWSVVSRASPSTRGTDPALVMTRRRLPAALYWAAVREVVPLARVERLLRETGARSRVRSGRRGLIGAAAAVAWPARSVTWELLAYRQPTRVGSLREVDPASVQAAERAEPALFLCHDPRTRRLLVAPHTRCPILYGLRGRESGAPLRARSQVRSEPVERWLLFRTNQATGDHLVPRRGEELASYQGAIVRGRIDGPTSVLPGGHVRFRLREAGGATVDCLAFEPTKTLPELARQLRPGDRLLVWGSVGRRRLLRLEGITLERLAEAGGWSPPRCRRCERQTHSLGVGRGWRCERCGRRFPLEEGRWTPRDRGLVPTTVHPTPSARRHLAPLPGAGFAPHQSFYGGTRSH